MPPTTLGVPFSLKPRESDVQAMKEFSIKIYDNKKGWPKRGIRACGRSVDEAISLVKEKKGIPQDERVLVVYRVLN